MQIDFDKFEEVVLPKILASEKTCKMYLMELKKAGAQFSVDIKDLSHEDAIEICLKIYSHVKMKGKGFEERSLKKEIH